MTEVGSIFVANYPPFSQWQATAEADVLAALRGPHGDVPLGLYLHIPFCRKRCKFCYYRVYTDRNADQIEQYMAALGEEIRILSSFPCLDGRPLRFVYFGGGTPSFPSVRQLVRLVDRLRESIDWDQAEEVTFECEPGTLSEAKVRTLKQLGVTRLSLGVENFSGEVLRENGRAHLAPEIYRSWDWIEAADFPNVNIDLIAGMVGETWENWQDCIARTLQLGPDSVTIYQMELPYNTVYSGEILSGQMANPVADWPTKRAWTGYAFDRLEEAGYQVSSAYTLVKDPAKVNFAYRDHLWQGSDLLAAGVASFGHVSGVHYQNFAQWNAYLEPLRQGQLPIGRGLRPTRHQLLVRETILQLKRGRLDSEYFRQKFGVDILAQWRSVWTSYQEDGLLTFDDTTIRLSRKGLLRVDSLLPALFEPEHQGVRYT